MFTIGVFAELTGVSAKRLRHYDSIGLFVPAYVDPTTRYRFYTASQIPALRRIASLSDLGVPLREIRASVETGAVQAALERRRMEITAQRAELDRKLAALDIELELESALDVVILTRPAGRWASIRTRISDGADLSPLFVEAESVVLKQGRRARRPPAAVDHGRVGADRDVEVLIPTTGPLDAIGRVRNVRSPAAQVAATLVQGDYPELGQARSIISAWAAGAGYRLAGPAWIVYLRFSAEPDLDVPAEFLTDRPDYVSEIQIQVE